jgi:uncharacterized damage-inducible protein DinB
MDFDPFHSVNQMLGKILQNTERIMADVTNLQAADNALKAEVTQAITDWQAALAAANGDQAAVDAVTADMQATVAQLQSSDPSTGTSNTGTPPVTPAS